MRLDLLQRCQCSCHKWWSQSRRVAKSPTGLKQAFPHGGIAGQKGTTAAKGFAEGAADQMHWVAEAMAETSAAAPQDPQGMGFINE